MIKNDQGQGLKAKTDTDKPNRKWDKYCTKVAIKLHSKVLLINFI